MKRTVFGIFIMAVGMALLITGTTLFTVSARDGEEPQAPEAVEQENCVYVGEYYKNGDITSDKVTVSDTDITFADGTVLEYSFSVWKDMPETDEGSGKITYRDYCFLKLTDGRLSYDPLAKEVTIDNTVYSLIT